MILLTTSASSGTLVGHECTVPTYLAWSTTVYESNQVRDIQSRLIFAERRREVPFRSHIGLKTGAAGKYALPMISIRKAEGMLSWRTFLLLSSYTPSVVWDTRRCQSQDAGMVIVSKHP